MKLFPFLLAFLLPLAAATVKECFDPLIGYSTPFLLFFGAIIGVAWHGGHLAGFISTFWSAALAEYLFLPPRHSFNVGVLGWTQCCIFALEGLFIALLTANARTAQNSLLVRTSRQSALAQISQAALSKDDLDLIFARCEEICARVLGATRAQILRDANSAPGASLHVPIGRATPFFGVLAVSGVSQPETILADKEWLEAVAQILTLAIERRQSLQAQQDSEARYRAFVAQSSEAIWCCEFAPGLDLSQDESQLVKVRYDSGFLAECNDVFARMHGFERAVDLIGTPLKDIWDRNDPRNAEVFRAFLRSDCNMQDVRVVETNPQGQQKEFSGNLVGIVEDNQLKRIWITQRDITAEREANAQLRISEERFRALFDAAPVPISISRRGILLYVNEASVALLGAQNASELVGLHINTFAVPTEHETMTGRIARRAAGSDEPQSYEAMGRRLDGKTMPLRIEVKRLELPDGEATLGFAFDLTEEKANQAQRDTLLEKERAAARRAALLQEVTASLAGAQTEDDVAHVIVGQGVAALEATSGALSVPYRDQQGHALRIMASVGYSEQILRDYNRVPLDSGLPLTVAFLESRPFWFQTSDEAIAFNPFFADVLPVTGTKALCALPLEVEGRVLGVFSLSFNREQQFDDDWCAFTLTLASQCAQAFDRVRLLAQARDAARLQAESLALLKTLLDSAPVGLAFFDLAGRHVMINEALCQIDGLTVEDHLGRTIEEAVPYVSVKVGRAIRDVIKTGLPSGELEVNSPPDAQGIVNVHTLSSFYPVRTTQGELLGVGAVILDVTARLRDERERIQLLGELEIERARFEAILQQMPSAVIIAEAPSGKLILGNSQVENIWKQPFRASPNVESHTTDYQVLDESGRPLVPYERPMARAITKGEVITGEEIIIKRGDGTRAIIRVNAAPIRDRDGHITAGVAIFDDVTERARAEGAQRFLAEASSALLSTLNETALYARMTNFCVPIVADRCFIALPTGDAIHLAAIDETGDRSEPTNFALPLSIADVMLGQKARLYKQPSLQIDAEFGALLQASGARSCIIAPLAARGRVLGVLIWVAAQIHRPYDEADLQLAEELARRIALTADNARLYAESEQAREEAEEANRAKDEFLAVVSHELRTPLTPILGWVDLLRAASHDAAIHDQALDVIERNAKAQAQIINDILDVSRITTGKLRFDFKAVPIATLIELAIEMQRPVAANKRLRIETAIENVGTVRADANRLQQVVWNLLQNAIKFTPENGTIHVSLHRRDDKAILQVRDSGSGITAEFLPHVFDRFRQADSSASRKAGGLGLGLAIVWHIVQGHGGTVSAQSAGEGEGAIFTVELPIQTDVPITPPLPPKPTPALSGLRILVTDDEPDTREMMQKLLEYRGAFVQTAANARQALDIIAQGAPDLLVCDIGMPEIDGYDLRTQLTTLGFNKPSIALTAYTAPNDIKKAREAGFDAHLAKPVEAEKLVSLVADLGQRK